MTKKKKKKEIKELSSYIICAKGICVGPTVVAEGGWAYILFDEKGEPLEQETKGELHTTNNRMEIEAIMRGCLKLPYECNVLIISDSQYAISVLSGECKAKVNRDLIDNFERITRKMNVSYRWIRMHGGYEWHEKCNDMAVQSMTKIREEYDGLE